jgi:ubiquinone biosynthesis protein
MISGDSPLLNESHVLYPLRFLFRPPIEGCNYMKSLARTITTYATGATQTALRAQQIALICSSYGLAGSLMASGIEVGNRGLKFAKIKKGAPANAWDKVVGKKLVKTLVKLGPTFIKLGQVLATRPDLVGDEVTEQLRVLYEHVPAIPFREIQKILRRELGKTKVKEWFKSIDPKPLASASMGQTHRAVLKDGTPVILKVQKPNVAKTVKLDLNILESLARSVHAVYPKLQFLPIFNDFKEATLREIDYLEEAKNIDRFARNYSKLFSTSEVKFPKYYPELTTQRVLALEPLQGKRAYEMRKGSTVARDLASKSLSAILEQIFDHGFFHADPHAGNLFFLEDEGRVGFIDLGLVGHLDNKDKKKFLKVVLAVLKRDRDSLAKALFALGTPSAHTDYAKFEGDIQTLLDDVKKQGIDKLRMDQMVNRLLVIARKNGLVIPNRYVMMIRSCVIIEGVARALDPKISMFEIATPIVTRSLLKTYNPLGFLKRLF